VGRPLVRILAQTANRPRRSAQPSSCLADQARQLVPLRDARGLQPHDPRLRLGQGQETRTQRSDRAGHDIGSRSTLRPAGLRGLETLDARADVFALAAITYECTRGWCRSPATTVPRLLLATSQDPEPVSKKSRDRRSIRSPRRSMNVLESRLAKNPNIRTKSVGDFRPPSVARMGFVAITRRGRRSRRGPRSRRESRRPRHALRRRLMAAAVDPFVCSRPFARSRRRRTRMGSREHAQHRIDQGSDGARAATHADGSLSPDDGLRPGHAGGPAGRSAAWLIIMVGLCRSARRGLVASRSSRYARISPAALADNVAIAARTPFAIQGLDLWGHQPGLRPVSPFW